MAAELLTLTERQLQLSYEESVVAEQLQAELPNRPGWMPLLHEAVIEGARSAKVPFYNLTTRVIDQVPFSSRRLVRALTRVKQNIEAVRAAGLGKKSVLEQAAAQQADARLEMACKFFTSIGRHILQNVAMRPDFRDDSEWEEPLAGSLLVASVAALYEKPFGSTSGEFNKGVLKCMAVSRPPGVPPRRITDFHPPAIGLEYSKMMLTTANFHQGLTHDVKRAGILSIEVKGEKRITCALSGDATFENLGFGFGGDVIGITSTGLSVTAYDIMLKQEDSIKAYQYLGYLMRAYESLIEMTAEGALQATTVHNQIAEIDCEARVAKTGKLLIQQNNWYGVQIDDWVDIVDGTDIPNTRDFPPNFISERFILPCAGKIHLTWDLQYTSSSFSAFNNWEIERLRAFYEKTKAFVFYSGLNTVYNIRIGRIDSSVCVIKCPTNRKTVFYTPPPSSYITGYNHYNCTYHFKGVGASVDIVVHNKPDGNNKLLLESTQGVSTWIVRHETVPDEPLLLNEFKDDRLVLILSLVIITVREPEKNTLIFQRGLISCRYDPTCNREWPTVSSQWVHLNKGDLQNSLEKLCLRFDVPQVTVTGVRCIEGATNKDLPDISLSYDSRFKSLNGLTKEGWLFSGPPQLVDPEDAFKLECVGADLAPFAKIQTKNSLAFTDMIALFGAKRPSRKTWTVTDSKLGMYGEHSEPHAEAVFRSLSGFEVSCNTQDVVLTEVESKWFQGNISKERLQPLADELQQLQLFPELEKIMTDNLRVDFGKHYAHILRHKGCPVFLAPKKLEYLGLVGGVSPLLVDDEEGVAYTSPLSHEWSNLDQQQVSTSQVFSGVGKLKSVEDRYDHFKVRNETEMLFQVTDDLKLDVVSVDDCSRGVEDLQTQLDKKVFSACDIVCYNSAPHNVAFLYHPYLQKVFKHRRLRSSKFLSCLGHRDGAIFVFDASQRAVFKLTDKTEDESAFCVCAAASRKNDTLLLEGEELEFELYKLEGLHGVFHQLQQERSALQLHLDEHKGVRCVFQASCRDESAKEIYVDVSGARVENLDTSVDKDSDVVATHNDTKLIFLSAAANDLRPVAVRVFLRNSKIFNRFPLTVSQACNYVAPFA
ncbi:uncharacterized protein LOC132204381 [Neocloeon triangulifer]|uniref:uncharacterized protein LOC132204381 n=1 Tax=Neocloeon triangulifer TaxID=2078957 RepID=UPI00286F84F5|nr:uncharacterized protein LOC132204381 [Neocloeon triangulifer]XP_059488850.1 uncharacterized protein LOC132204381 [Neocloeon triangulifer]